MKKIHLNAVKIFLFLVTAILNEGLSSSGEIKVNFLGYQKGERWSTDNKRIWFLANQNLGLSGWYRSSLLFATFYCAQCQYLSLYFRNCSYHLPCMPPACELVSIVCGPISFY